MNYYPFHIGDYATHTAHLEMLEDLAYRRLIDLYYLRETAIPQDVQEVARLIRMKAQTECVESVLREFFELTEDGWHHGRCAEELARMQKKKEALSEKDQHEKGRTQRFRERRSLMFAALREKEIVPSWDIAMKELQCLFDDNCNAPETLQARNRPVTGNATLTAIPTPTPTPTPINPVTSLRSVVAKRPEEVPEDIWRDFQSVRKAKRSPLTPKAFEGVEREAKKAGITITQALTICVERGWQGFQASWDWKGGAGRGQPPENFAAKDYGKGGDL